MLRGEEGTQRKELDRLVDWLLTQPKPDIVCLSNALLIGLARRIHDRVGAKLVCTLSGEDGFLDALSDPYRERAWELMRDRLRDADHCIAVSNYYAEVMRRRAKIESDRLTTIHNGIELAGYEPAGFAPDPPVIGYLARMHPTKGLHTLVDAYIELRRRDTGRNPRLCIVGAMTPGDAAYVDAQRDKLRAAGVDADASFHPNVDLAEKQRLLRSMSVLSVPATYGEAFGLYILEALASGVAVVQPRHAVFPELLALTGGGILCEPDDPTSLADAIGAALADPAGLRERALTARRTVMADFSAERMAERIAEVFESVAAGRAVHNARGVIHAQ
jgi:glycosyltransferase involved in cell wall biosynthesis